MEEPGTPAPSGSDPELERRFASLRERMVGLSRRRVPEEDIEDVVQAALHIVVERGVLAEDREAEGLPPIAWCLQVLRNVIGNHYRRRDTRRRHVEPLSATTVQDSVQTDPDVEGDRVQQLEDALDDFAQQDETCGRILRQLADGRRAREIARQMGRPTASLYQRIYRCREKFRSMLRERGVLE